jgi:hypothetical protein
MIAVIQFFADYVVLIYLILLVALLYSLRLYSRTRHELSEAVFSLELELARRHQGHAIAALFTIGLLALAEFILIAFLVPNLPALVTVRTTTGSLASITIGTSKPDIVTTPYSGIPQTNPISDTSGCIPGQIMITSPGSGDQIRGKITLVGTAKIPNFGFYKYEFSPAGADSWVTIQAGSEVRQEESLGDWDLSEITPGDYLLRLVVTDNQGLALPACIVPIRILNP